MAKPNYFTDSALASDGALLRAAAGATENDTLANDLPEVVSGTNLLVAAANPVLNLVPQLRATVHHPDPGALRDYLIEQIKVFELRARQAMINNETIIGARYCLCTVLDETAAQTPWGGSGSWSRHSLLVTFHNETSGGEKFFQLLSKLAQNPQQHAELLELMYYCLALGFEGRFKVAENGRSQLETLKQRLLGILASAKGEPDRALSQHWQGEPPRKQRAWMYLPVWVLACIAGGLAALLYLFFTFRLAESSDGLFAAINAIHMPHILVETAAPAPPKSESPRLATFLAPEIRDGLVQVRDEADRSVVTLTGDGLFANASANVTDRYIPVIGRIGEALNAVPGSVIVAGYTDNTAIRTFQFPSNWELSQARAEAVQKLLNGKVAPARTRAIGRGTADPIAPNDTPANRARNRRVEITLMIAADNKSQ